MFRALVGAFAGAFSAVASYDLLKQFVQAPALPRSSNIPSTEVSHDPLLKVHDGNVSVNVDALQSKASNILRAIHTEIHEVNTSSEAYANQHSKAFFAPTLNMQAKKVIVGNLPEGTKVSLEVRSKSQLLLIEAKSSNCGWFSCERNQFQASLPLDVDVAVPEHIAFTRKI